MKIFVECAWCRKFMGAKKNNRCGASAPRVSHSICPTCQEKLLSETSLSLHKMKHPRRFMVS